MQHGIGKLTVVGFSFALLVTLAPYWALGIFAQDTFHHSGVRETWFDGTITWSPANRNNANDAQGNQVFEPENEQMDCTGIQTFTSPMLIEPIGDVTLETITPLFRWDIDEDMVLDGIWVNIEVATDPDFNNIVERLGFGYETGQDSMGEFRFPTNLSSATDHYWRGQLGCRLADLDPSPYSPTASFTTGSTGEVPSNPDLVSPADGSTVWTGPVTVEWLPVDGATEYLVRWGDLDCCYRFVWTSDTKTTFEADTGGTYDWWVSGRNDYAIGPDSDIWQVNVTVPVSLTLSYSVGAPGSFFSLVGSGFNANTPVSVLVNNEILGTVQTNDGGELRATLNTDKADLGTYVVTVGNSTDNTRVVQESASASTGNATYVTFVLSAAAPLRPHEGVGTVVDVPAGIALDKGTYLPLVATP